MAGFVNSLNLVELDTPEMVSGRLGSHDLGPILSWADVRSLRSWGVYSMRVFLLFYMLAIVSSIWEQLFMNRLIRGVFYFVLDGRDAPAHARARGRSKDGASGGWLTAEAFLAISCF